MTSANPPGTGPEPGSETALDSGRIAAHLTTVADVLTELATEIEELGTSLCMDPAILTSHMATLQSIDLIAQKQRWLATLLQADCPLSAVQTIGVEALKARFASPHTH
jgi:hypothetical protein